MAQPSSVEELKRLLAQANQRSDDFKQQIADLKQQRADLKQKRADFAQQRADSAQRAERAEEQIRPTTLEEYIAACHDLVFSKFTLGRDKRLISKGFIANSRNDNWCPTHLRPWSGFLEQQRVISGELYDAFPAQRRVFENRCFLAVLGNRISQWSMANEKTLWHFLRNSVEDPVSLILQQLKHVEELNNAFDMGKGIIFETQPHVISDVAEEVVEREPPSTPPRASEHTRGLNQLRPNQICVYRSNDDRSRSLIYVSEYKSPHKLTAPYLRLGLRAMNIPKDVVNRETPPMSADPHTRFQYHAERLTASAITQIYHYMIEGGLEYGLLTTGEAIVFLKIDWKEPETLYYHLAEPGPEISAHPDHYHVYTAVGQHLAFSLMALGRPGERQMHGQDDRRQATLHLSTWAEDFETTLRSIPESERLPPDDPPAHNPIPHADVDRSSYLFRGKKRRTGADQVEESLTNVRPEPSDDESEHISPHTSSLSHGGKRTRHSHETQAKGPRRGGEQTREYCTQNCLLGLVRQELLDPECPNVALHRGQDGCDGDGNRTSIRTHADPHIRHPVDHAEWVRLLSAQLKRSLDDGIKPLGDGGARGVLFQVTLLAYGYTFVSKGTVRAFIPDLEHEAAVYERLRPIQGVNTPVFLGAVDLRSMNKIYYYDHRVYVVYMMFLSWGGRHIRSAETVDSEGGLLEDKAVVSVQAMHREGVIHRDVRIENMLFNPETDGVMIIDFERASLLEPPSRTLQQMVPNKRPREQDSMDIEQAAGSSLNQSQSSRGFSEDILMARVAF